MTNLVRCAWYSSDGPEASHGTPKPVQRSSGGIAAGMLCAITDRWGRDVGATGERAKTFVSGMRNRRGTTAYLLAACALGDAKGVWP